MDHRILKWYGKYPVEQALPDRKHYYIQCFTKDQFRIAAYNHDLEFTYKDLRMLMRDFRKNGCVELVV